MQLFVFYIYSLLFTLLIVSFSLMLAATPRSLILIWPLSDSWATWELFLVSCILFSMSYLTSFFPYNIIDICMT